MQAKINLATLTSRMAQVQSIMNFVQKTATKIRLCTVTVMAAINVTGVIMDNAIIIIMVMGLSATITSCQQNLHRSRRSRTPSTQASKILTLTT